MKRDLDLCRQLLLEIENRGADCSVSVLRTANDQEAEQRVRHHIRLLIDGGYLKEVDRTTEGVPCVRLTDAGHELVELTRLENRWREAKWVCQQRTGGLSLAVVQAVLLHWALPTPGYRRGRRYYSPAEPLASDRAFSPSPGYRLEPYRDEEWDYAPEDVRYLRLRPSERNGWRHVAGYNGGEVVDSELAPSLPEYLL